MPLKCRINPSNADAADHESTLCLSCSRVSLYLNKNLKKKRRIPSLQTKFWRRPKIRFKTQLNKKKRKNLNLNRRKRSTSSNKTK